LPKNSRHADYILNQKNCKAITYLLAAATYPKAALDEQQVTLLSAGQADSASGALPYL
jgi:hypothetical protein